MRVDVMAKMRGVADFADLWERRTVLQAPDGTRYDLMALSDLVKAKKTQRDKDWPMIRRLIEADVAATASPPEDQVEFWLRECRTPELILSLVAGHPGIAETMAGQRAAIAAAFQKDEAAVTTALRAEEDEERQTDKAYWLPLKRELEVLRHARGRSDRLF